MKFTPKAIYWFSIAYILYVVLLAVNSGDTLAPEKWPSIYDKPLGEDGYYMLTIARDYKLGSSFYYNGRWTNGIQPLFTIFEAGVFSFTRMLHASNDLTPIRTLMVINGLLHLLLASLITLLVKKTDTKARVVLFVAALFSPYLFGWFHYGLETGFYLIFVLLWYLYEIKYAVKNSLVRGLLIGICVLTRIDFIVVCAIYYGLSLIKGKYTIKELLVTGVTALVVASPWFLYNYRFTGNFIPSSGPAQVALFASPAELAVRAKSAFEAMLNALFPFLWNANTGTYLLSLVLLGITVALLVRNRQWARRIWLSMESRFRYFLMAIIALNIIYMVFFWADHFYARYMILTIFPCFAFFARMLEHLTLPRYYYTGIIAGVILCFSLFTYGRFHRGTMNGSLHLVTAKYIQQKFSKVKVGCFQSGIIGYLNPNVINLDGKVNYEALQYLKSHTIHTYIEQQHINVLIDWPSYISNIDADYLKAHFALLQDDIAKTTGIGNSSIVYVRIK